MPPLSRSQDGASRLPAPTSIRPPRRRRRARCATRAARRSRCPSTSPTTRRSPPASPACEERFGDLGSVAALAAIEGAIAPVEAYDPATFDRVLAVNVRGVYLTLRHALPALRRAGAGSVVTVASQAGLRGVPGLSGYVASKHAVVGLTKGVRARGGAGRHPRQLRLPGPDRYADDARHRGRRPRGGRRPVELRRPHPGRPLRAAGGDRGARSCGCWSTRRRS